MTTADFPQGWMAVAWFGFTMLAMAAAIYSVCLAVRNGRAYDRRVAEIQHHLDFARRQARTAERAAVEAQQQAQRTLQARVATLEPGEWLHISPADRDACERMANRIKGRLSTEAPTDRFRHLFHHYADGLCRTATAGPVRKPPRRFDTHDGLGMFVCSRPAGHLGRYHVDLRAGRLRGWWAA